MALLGTRDLWGPACNGNHRGPEDKDGRPQPTGHSPWSTAKTNESGLVASTAVITSGGWTRLGTDPLSSIGPPTWGWRPQECTQRCISRSTSLGEQGPGDSARLAQAIDVIHTSGIPGARHRLQARKRTPSGTAPAGGDAITHAPCPAQPGSDLGPRSGTDRLGPPRPSSRSAAPVACGPGVMDDPDPRSAGLTWASGHLCLLLHHW